MPGTDQHPTAPTGEPAQAELIAASRTPMDMDRVAALLPPGRYQLGHSLQTGSTNSDLAARAAARPAADGGAASGWPVLVTEEQIAGRGRSGRSWACPAGGGLMFSVLVPVPLIPAGRRGWVGAVLGLSIVQGLERAGGLRTELKWPNDVLAGGAKCAGILAETAGADAVVVGSGINVSLLPTELPRVDSTSLLLAGAGLERVALLAAILHGFADRMDRWSAAGGDVDAAGIRPEYLERCATIGTRIRLELPGGTSVSGNAVDVDPAGAIVIALDAPPGAVRGYAAGDVVHLRTTDGPGRTSSAEPPGGRR